MRDYHAFAQRVLSAQRSAILDGRAYRGPSLYDAMDPTWHDVERADDADLQRINGDPSHFDGCETCASRRADQAKEDRIAARREVA